MNAIKDFLSGKKTYLLGALGVIWSVVGWVAGWLDPIVAQEYLWASLVVLTGRAAISKVAE